MTEPSPSFFGMRTHHVVIAVALVSNYYLW